MVRKAEIAFCNATAEAVIRLQISAVADFVLLPATVCAAPVVSYGRRKYDCG